MLNRLRVSAWVRAWANRAALAGLALGAAAGPGFAKPPIEAFSDAPQVYAAHLSPDGRYVAFINHVSDGEVLALYDFSTAKTRVLGNVSNLKTRGLFFVGDNHIILRASTTAHMFNVLSKFEYTAAFSHNIATGKTVQLLTRTEGLYPAQSGLGRIVGVDPDGDSVLMPAFMSRPGTSPSLDLLRVNLDTGRGVRVAGKTGTSFTQNWIVDGDSNVVAREDYDKTSHAFEIRAIDGKNGGLKLIYGGDDDQKDGMTVVGVSKESGALIVTGRQDSQFMSLYEMSRSDGSLKGPLLTRTDADIDQTIEDENHEVFGVRYSGMRPSYEMFDPALDAMMKSIVKGFPGEAVSLASWSRDWSKVLLFIDGGAEPSSYIIFDRATHKYIKIADARPDIPKADIGETAILEYKARDGLRIPGLITWPAGVPEDKRKNLPLIVLPHGGPQAYDQVGFNWLAQFFANEGYVVLQPNFRGSAGFGAEFIAAGQKEWGRKMQDDITDGVKALQGQGWADPNRTCIVGWSYGGYAALAGGALTPDLYKCIVSIAGPSDLRAMLAWERVQHGGADGAPYVYWRSVIGDPDADKDAIDAVSPARLVANYKAPVLLIHGSDDTTVPSEQSSRMENVLKNAGKTVTYIRMKGDDHNMVMGDDRTVMLTTIRDFVKANIGQ
jgi:dipeptidyl aminopeptidase/acylaminoacyl peptidase